MPQTQFPIPLTALTPVSTTSGTLFDFAIPANVKKITLTVRGMSSNQTSHFQVRLGTALNGIITTGYRSNFSNQGDSMAGANITSGFGFWSQNALDSSSGVMILTRIEGNVWAYSWSGGLTNGSNFYGNTGGGFISLADTLTTLRLTTVSGTATFTAGSAGVMYE